MRSAAAASMEAARCFAEAPCADVVTRRRQADGEELLASGGTLDSAFAITFFSVAGLLYVR